MLGLGLGLEFAHGRACASLLTLAVYHASFVYTLGSSYSDTPYSDISKWVMQWVRVRVRIRVRDRVRDRVKVRVRVRVSVSCAFSEAFAGIGSVGIGTCTQAPRRYC